MQGRDGGIWPHRDPRTLDRLLRAIEDAREIQDLEALRVVLIGVVGELIDQEEIDRAAERRRGPPAAAETSPIEARDVQRLKAWTGRIARLRWGRIRGTGPDGPSPRTTGAGERPSDEVTIDAFMAVLDEAEYRNSFYDLRRLPRTKEEIIVAIARRLGGGVDDEAAVLLRHQAHRLTFYQKGIGRRPLHVGGMRLESYDPKPGRHQFSSAITADPKRARLYDECLRRQEDDLRRFRVHFGVEARPNEDPLPDVFYLSGH